MMNAILGKKIGMTQVFDEKGELVPVTVVEAGPCYIAQVKTEEKDGYMALQLGLGETKRLNKPEKGHLKDLPPLKHLREIRVDSLEGYQVGQKIDASLFSAGDVVNVTGLSKGKGFAGVVKRHGFHGGPKTHGQSDRHRAPGAIGATTDPGRVTKGMRMAGHMGDDQVTVRNLRVVLVDAERNLLGLRGAIPGSRKGLVIISKVRGRK